MNYKKLYENQYGKEKLISCQARGISRYDIAEGLVEPGQRVLDIGCGDGDFLSRIKNNFSDCYGIDVAPSRLKKADPELKVLEHNADQPLPFADNFFDAVIALAVIEHVFDVFSLSKEIHRVLKPGAYVIAQVPNVAYLKHRVKLGLGKLPVTSSPYNWQEIGWDGGHLHYFTMKTFCNLFEHSGFEIKKKTGSGLWANVRNWWPSLCCGDLCIKAIKK